MIVTFHEWFCYTDFRVKPGTFSNILVIRSIIFSPFIFGESFRSKRKVIRAFRTLTVTLKTILQLLCKYYVSFYCYKLNSANTDPLCSKYSQVFEVIKCCSKCFQISIANAKFTARLQIIIDWIDFWDDNYTLQVIIYYCELYATLLLHTI